MFPRIRRSYSLVRSVYVRDPPLHHDKTVVKGWAWRCWHNNHPSNIAAPRPVSQVLDATDPNRVLASVKAASIDARRRRLRLSQSPNGGEASRILFQMLP